MSAGTRAEGETPQLGILVVNYGSSSLLAANLAGRGIGGPRDLVVIVDNSEDPEERSAVRALCAAEGWHLVPLPHNPGFGAGVNAGIAAARGAGCVTFLCLNPDAQVTQPVVDALREASLADPLAMIGTRIVNSSGEVVFRGARLSLADGRILGPAGDEPGTEADGARCADWLTGACLVVHADLLDRMGGFADDYFLYWEDVDLSYRCMRAGGRLLLRDDLTVVHDEGGTQGSRRGRAKSAAYYRWNCRNRLVFAARHLAARDVLRWMALTPAVSWEILVRGGRRQLLQSTRPLRATVRGSLEGLAVAGWALLGGSRGAGSDLR